MTANFITREFLRALFQAYQPEEFEDTAHSSAVMVLFVYEGNDIFLVVTKRADKIAYAGDFCFPGGARDGIDHDFLQTAQRELCEELGITEKNYQMLGRLDDFFDRDGGRVRPYVAMMGKQEFDVQVKLNRNEVERVYFFPLADLMLFQVSDELEKVTKRHPSYLYMNDSVTIWGLTASMMVQVGNLVFGLERKVGKRRK